VTRDPDVGAVSEGWLAEQRGRMSHVREQKRNSSILSKAPDCESRRTASVSVSVIGRVGLRAKRRSQVVTKALRS
jgi:hypothetical protein